MDSTKTTEAAAASPGRVLVVDDDPVIRELTAAALTKAGHLVDIAKDGVEAWRILQLHGYDLLITDYNMPGLSGVQLIKNLRAAGMNLPVILVTGSVPDDEFSCRPWPEPEATLFKPITFAELFDAVRTVLRAHALRLGEAAGGPILPIVGAGPEKPSSKP